MSTEASASANSLDSQDTRLNGGMLSPIDVQFKLTLDATARQAAAQASRPLRLALDYASVTLPSIDDLESRFVVYIRSRCVVDGSEPCHRLRRDDPSTYHDQSQPKARDSRT